ncbi:hypothetical protein VT06_04035 [Arsukibacterium sp. MJ3]|uniref:hypothetical protein n=1 Tax=Arsukibacterium sp. MJ3 TaxID=1632859 RepID=UPI0006274316|nr:hypothetical protein [Arsukibacterium sp. MJ3]KKO49776.1 hypothetical protein VT06_04035 [Arsukibacterium sp. MJ3]
MDKSISLTKAVILKPWLRRANILLILSFVALLVTIVVCYPLAHWVPFHLQLVGHISMILSATLVKLSYIGRCIVQHELLQRVG